MRPCQRTWWLGHAGAQAGPFTYDQLRERAVGGGFAPDDLVWHDGLSDWQPAKQVPETAALFGSGAPVAPCGSLAEGLRPAGFWIRVAARLIDVLVLASVGVLGFAGLGVSAAMGKDDDGSHEVLGALALLLMLALAVGSWLYGALLESSPWQGTLGKRLLGLVVTDTAGRRISFGRATGRHFAHAFSAATLCAGYVLAAFSSRKQAMHDLVAGTLVVFR